MRARRGTRLGAGGGRRKERGGVGGGGGGEEKREGNQTLKALCYEKGIRRRKF